MRFPSLLRIMKGKLISSKRTYRAAMAIEARLRRLSHRGRILDTLSLDEKAILRPLCNRLATLWLMFKKNRSRSDEAYDIYVNRKCRVEVFFLRNKILFRCSLMQIYLNVFWNFLQVELLTFDAIFVNL